MKITLNTFFRWFWLLDRAVDDVDAMAGVLQYPAVLPGYAIKTRFTVVRLLP